ncbi:type I 3-dehydroquinate dehydratase [Thermoproteota archaeon]
MTNKTKWLAAIKQPRIVVPFKDQVKPDRIRYAFTTGCDIAEIRIDLFDNEDPAHILKEIMKFRKYPSILTIRSKSEGGRWTGDEHDRLTLYRRFISSINAVDIELSATEIFNDVVKVADDHNKTVIASFHDFNQTPDINELTAVIKQARAKGADIVKIATMINKPSDIQQLALVLIEHSDTNLVVIGMGPKGKITRVFFPALGSMMTFAQLDKQTAPGQLDLDSMVYDLYRYY